MVDAQRSAMKTFLRVSFYYEAVSKATRRLKMDVDEILAV